MPLHSEGARVLGQSCREALAGVGAGGCGLATVGAAAATASSSSTGRGLAVDGQAAGDGRLFGHRDWPLVTGCCALTPLERGLALSSQRPPGGHGRGAPPACLAQGTQTAIVDSVNIPESSLLPRVWGALLQ